MIRKFKAFGLALVALLAMGAFSAVGAQAQTTTLVAGEAGYVTGEQVEGGHRFKTGGGQVLTCNKAHFKGASQVSQTTISVTPEYSQCHTEPQSVFEPKFFVTVTHNECNYKFTNLQHTPPDYTADVTVECPVGKAIEVHLYTNSSHTTNLCTLTVGSQGPLPGNTITNVGGHPDDLLMHHNVTVVETRHGSSLCGPVTQNAVYTGTTTVKAFNNADEQTTLTAVTHP